jgi:two-component system sensor histidine kinase KdpD
VVRSPRAVTAAWLAVVLGVPIVTLALLPLDEEIGVPGVLLLLLLIPVCAAVLGGLGPALAASAVAFLFADWFYIEPTQSLRFRHAGDGLALVVFVVVSVVVSGLVDRLARRTAQLTRSQAETETLAQLASGTALLDAEALNRLVTELRVALPLEAVAVQVPIADGWRVEASSGSPVPPNPEAASYSAELVGGSMLVASGPSLPAEDRRLLSAFVAQLRLAQTTLRLQADALRATDLAEANTVREALLAAVSHDLRGPLANIKAAATSLLSDEVEWSAEDIETFCGTIDAEADRLHGVVSNLLDMGRVQAGMVCVQMRAVVVEEVVFGALASLSLDVSAVDVVIPPDLPLVLADPALLERAIANVVSNALGWTPEGARVRVEAGVAGGRADIRVVDRGAGIPRDQRERIFQPFQRLGDGGPAARDGIGLGLAVTRGFIDAMDGKIFVEDTPGGGATMVMTLGLA